jgi:mono/diheme cytochrome c family protein
VPATAPAGEDALAFGRALVDWYRCGGCHELEGQPGRLREHLDGDTLAPPRLDGEGARAQHSWLVGYLENPTVLRAWLPTRMPHYGFTPEEAAAFAAYFAALASVPAVDEPRPVAEPALLADGRARFEDYRCVQCHPAAGAPADGIPLADRAIDLDLARARLRPSWIAEFLARPSVIAGPRTRMPSVFFASDGSPAVAEPDREIEAITAFLLHMDETLAAPSAPTPEAVDWSTVDY